MIAIFHINQACQTSPIRLLCISLYSGLTNLDTIKIIVYLVTQHIDNHIKFKDVIYFPACKLAHDQLLRCR